MIRVVYLSSGVKIFSDEEIREILAVSRTNNKKNGITGLLLYSEGNFLQILEGKKINVENTYTKIKLDPRHKNLINIINEPIQELSFSEWKMGYSIIDKTFLHQHPEINPFNINLQKNSNSIVNSFINTFLSSFRNKVLYT